jgi:predicted ATPase
MIDFHYDTFTTSDGRMTEVPRAGVVVFVGPNNAGKSQALKDLVGHMRGADYIGKAITSVQVSKNGDSSDAEDWAQQSLPSYIREGVKRVAVPGWGEVGPQDFAGQWQNGNTSLGILAESLILFADGTTRLTAGNAQPNLDFRNQHPTHPIQRAYMQPELEEQFRLVAKDAFGLDVAVDRYAGSQIALRIGKRPEFRHVSGVPDAQYLEELAEMSHLDEQGDGVKSFMGLMIQLIAGRQKVIMVDEPEAFLHPPQARLLGAMLASRAVEQQVFLSTHSSAVLQGVLEAGVAVTIVRLTRADQVNTADVLNDEAVTELWSDPVLRYSNLLDGLFYDAVVLCEADSDCRYYSAVRDQLFPEGTGAGRRLELLFAQSGGKARFAVIVKALRAAGVPVVVVADFDILREASDIRKVFEALGGDWAVISKLRDIVAKALTADAKPLFKVSLKDALNEKLASMPDSLTPKDLESLRAILKVENGWDKAKRSGLSAVPQGDAYTAGEELLRTIASTRLLAVPVGELERFVPGVEGHGPTWVNRVLERGAHSSPSVEAVAFVSQIEVAAKGASGRATLEGDGDLAAVG